MDLPYPLRIEASHDYGLDMENRSHPKAVYCALHLALCALVLPILMTGSATAATLEYNQTLLITNSVLPVPAGRTWKVVGMHGGGTTSICSNVLANNGVAQRTFLARGIEINGTPHYTSFNAADNTYYWQGGNCTTNLQTNEECRLCCDGTGKMWCGSSGCTIIESDCHPAAASPVLSPLDFPVWLPAGTTLRTVAAGSFLSVLEFLVVP